MRDLIEADLEYALAALHEMRRVLEDNACAESPKDAATLRRVTSLAMDASAPVAGALGLVKMEKQLRAAIADAPSTVRSRLRLVR